MGSNPGYLLKYFLLYIWPFELTKFHIGQTSLPSVEIPQFIRPICPIGPTLKKASSGIRSQDFAPNVLNTIRCAGSECGCHGGSLRQARAAQRHATPPPLLLRL